MENDNPFEEFEKILKGLEEAYRRMVIFKKQKNTPLIISRNGKIVKIPAKDIPPTAEYRF